MSDIKIYGPYGDARKYAARDADPHGLPPEHIAKLGDYWDKVVGEKQAAKLGQMHDRLDGFMPRIVRPGGSQKLQTDYGSHLPNGGTFDPGAGRNYQAAIRQTHKRATGRDLQDSRWGSRVAYTPIPGDSGGNTFVSQETPYHPEFASPDRQNYPVHRILANRYWRLFWKLDPVVGNCLEMYANLIWSNFELTGEGVDGEVKDQMEHMCKLTKFRSMLHYLAQEFFVVGEAAPHCFYDDRAGIWTHIAMHNPDQLEVIDSPFIKMDPLVEFIPDDRLRQILTSNHPMLQSIRESMPDELIVRLMARQNIPLSPVNFTFIPRKLHPYDTRGTSLLSRMWRIFMYEDAIFQASIATARRHAGPIKVAKLGDPASGYYPPPEQEQRFLELLAQAESDVNAWIVYNHAVSFELVGTTDRVMSIDKHWDLIERIKLIAMGVSKSFLHGEVTYASSAAGLTVFLQRLKALREFFEDTWIYPKFFKPVAQMNGWIKPTAAELAHNVRTRRSAREVEEDGRLIIPTIEWDRKLDPQVDGEVINAMSTLTQTFGVKFSKRTLMSAVNRDYEDELRQSIEETETEMELAREHPEAATLLGIGGLMPPGGEGGDGGGGGMPPGGGGAILPPVPGEMFSEFPGGEPGGAGEAPPAPGGPGAPEAPAASKEADEGAEDAQGGARGPQSDKLTSKLWQDGRYGDWSEEDVLDLVELFDSGDTDNDPWLRMTEESKMVRDALKMGDDDLAWAATEDWLIQEGYPSRVIQDLEDILKSEGVLYDPLAGHTAAIMSELDEVSRSIGDSTDDSFFAGVK